jgi:hypothetical protein
MEGMSVQISINTGRVLHTAANRSASSIAFEGKIELADDACKERNFHHLFPHEPQIHFVHNPQINRYVRAEIG